MKDRPIRFVDCAGQYPSMGVQHFRMMIDKDGESSFFVNIGLKSIEFLIAGRYRAKKLEDLFEYERTN